MQLVLVMCREDALCFNMVEQGAISASHTVRQGSFNRVGQWILVGVFQPISTLCLSLRHNLLALIG